MSTAKPINARPILNQLGCKGVNLAKAAGVRLNQIAVMPASLLP